MTIYPDQQKAELIERMLPPHNVPVVQLARETGIPKDTLYGWRRQGLRAQDLPPPPAPAGAGQRPWSSEEKFTMVVETAPLSEAERGEYCRKRGLYPEHLQSWRQACQQANNPSPQRAGAGKPSDGGDKRRIRELERQLRRKEQALAETAALLVLGKKARAIWGKDGDE